MSAPLTGLWSPVATPFSEDGAVDHDRLAVLGRCLLADGASGLVLLGTTGEAASLSLAERRALVDAMIERGFDPSGLMVGAGSSALPDAVEMVRHAADIGAAAVLLLPPFYYKGVSDDGLFAFVAEVIGRSGPELPRVLLYHFPSLAGAGWSLPLIARLHAAFPKVIAGLKDLGGDEAHTLKLIATFPELAIFPGSESNLLGSIAAGAAGFITTSGNVNAAALAALIARPDAPDAEERLAHANAIRVALKARGLFPSVKAVIARQMGDDMWLMPRPPLTALSAADRTGLYADPAIAGLLARTAVR